MKPLEMTLELAQAIGFDAGNASMRKADRKTWNMDDVHVAYIARLAALRLLPRGKAI